MVTKTRPKKSKQSKTSTTSTTTALTEKALTESSESLIPAEERVDMNAEVVEYAESLISPEERLSLISEAAYYRAEQRGFIHGENEQDWLEAERDVDEMLLDAAKKANY